MKFWPSSQAVLAAGLRWLLLGFQRQRVNDADMPARTAFRFELWMEAPSVVAGVVRFAFRRPADEIKPAEDLAGQVKSFASHRKKEKPRP